MTTSLVLATVLVSLVEGIRGLRLGVAPVLVGVAAVGFWIFPDWVPLRAPSITIPALLGTVVLFHSSRDRSMAECLLPTLLFVSAAAPSFEILGVSCFVTALAHACHRLEADGDLEPGPLAIRLVLCLAMFTVGIQTPAQQLLLGMVSIAWILSLPKAPHFAFVFGMQGILLSLLLPGGEELRNLITAVGLCGAALSARITLGNWNNKEKGAGLMGLAFSWMLVLGANGVEDWLVATLSSLVSVVLALRGLQWTYGSHDPQRWGGAPKETSNFWIVLQGSSALTLFSLVAGAASVPLSFSATFFLVIGLLVAGFTLGTLCWIPVNKKSKKVGRPGWNVIAGAGFFLALSVGLIGAGPLPGFSSLTAFGVITLVAYLAGRRHLVPLPAGPPSLSLGWLKATAATVERIERLVVDRVLLDQSASLLSSFSGWLSRTVTDSRAMPWIVFAMLMALGVFFAIDGGLLW